VGVEVVEVPVEEIVGVFLVPLVGGGVVIVTVPVAEVIEVVVGMG
jgi:hypothetical protein